MKLGGSIGGICRVLLCIGALVNSCIRVLECWVFWYCGFSVLRGILRVANWHETSYITQVMNTNQQIVDFLSERLPKLKGVYLFGSRAENRVRPESDVDIAFLVKWGHSPTSMQKWEWSVELSAILEVESVDLVDLQQAKTDFRFVIISTSKRIFCEDKAYCDTFEMIAYSMYQRLELERREIIEAVKKRGKIYG